MAGRGKSSEGSRVFSALVIMALLFLVGAVGLWDKLSWSGLYAVVLGVLVLQLIIANIWVRFFTNGLLEWAWRSLAYVRWQPFRNRASG